MLLLVALLPACMESAGFNNDRTLKEHEQAAEGTVVFWQDGKPAYGLTTVTIKEETKEVTRDLPAGNPSCFTAGCASFTLPAGNYKYSAKEAYPGTATWAGTVTITEFCCLTVELH